MKIAIIEDEQLHADLLAAYLRTWAEKNGERPDISAFPSAETFLFAWQEEKDFDVLFIDIQMKEMNGMEMAKRIRAEDEETAIVFTTGISDYLEEGYEVDAVHYLLKPISEEKIGMCMDKIKKRRKTENFLLVHHGEEVRKLPIERINYVEARGHGCVLGISGQNGKDKGENGGEFAVTESISELEKALFPYHFVKCHRSYLCRIAGIHHIDKKEIFFDDGSHIPVSRRLYGEINRAFIEYFRKL